MKGTNWKKYIPILLYFSLALVWALSAGLSEALITHNFAETSKRQQQHGLIQQYYEAVQRGDLARAVETMADDVKVRIPESLPFGGVYEGHEGVRKFLTAVNTRLPLRQEVRQILDSGTDEVMALMTLKKSADTAVTGSTLELPLVGMFRVQDGRIRELRLFASDDSMLKKLTER